MKYKIWSLNNTLIHRKTEMGVCFEVSVLYLKDIRMLKMYLFVLLLLTPLFMAHSTHHLFLFIFTTQYQVTFRLVEVKEQNSQHLQILIFQ
jgi:hypothetical protein